jgi:hypothetical protein
VDDRPEELAREPVTGPREGAEERTPYARVGTVADRRKPGRGRLDGPLEDDRARAVERVGGRRERVDPLNAMAFEVERAKEWRRERGRVDRGAGIVDETAERQLGRSGAAAGRRRGLENLNAATGAREGDGRRQPIRAGTDDDRIERPRSAQAFDPSVASSSRRRNMIHGWLST